MLKSNPLSELLVGVLLVISLFACVLSLSYTLNVRTLGRLQARAFLINKDQALLQALVSDCVEYSKKNPAMEPLLQTISSRNRPGTAQPPANAPTK